MFCKSCGKEIADDSKVCSYCGVQVAAPAAAPVAAPEVAGQFNVLGLIGMILGILSIVFFWAIDGILGLAMSITGLVLSNIGLKKVGMSKGMAKAGKITSIIGLVFSAIYLVIVVLVVGIIVGLAGSGLRF